MDQIEFLELYRQEKPIFQAWGEYLIKDINAELQSSGIDINAFLKIFGIRFMFERQNSKINGLYNSAVY